MFRTMCPVDQTYEDFLLDLLGLRQVADVIELEVVGVDGKYHVVGFKQDAPIKWPYPDKPSKARGMAKITSSNIKN